MPALKLLIIILFAIGNFVQADSSLPKIVILATGGTIAGAGESSSQAHYQAAKAPIETLINAVPEIHQIATIEGEQVAQVASQAMSNQIWLTLAQKVQSYLERDDVTGIVITHGTDTLEETAYFLHLTVNSHKPVVLVGSMRPPTSLSADGSLNLYNAVATAAAPVSRGKGILVAFNEEIHGARAVTKNHTSAVNAFSSPGKGPLGRVEYGNVQFYREPVKARTSNSPFNVLKRKTLPPVAIVYGHANASPAPVTALVKAGFKGIVSAGVGNGNLFPSVEKALAKASDKGVIVVRSSRVGSGRVLRNAEVDDDKLGFIVADDLSPQKARILLQLALTKTQDLTTLQDYFFRY